MTSGCSMGREATLNAPTNALAILDPGSDETLFGTSAGIFAVSAEGNARQLTCNGAPGRSIRALAVGARPDIVLARGDEGLFEIDTKTTTPGPGSLN